MQQMLTVFDDSNSLFTEMQYMFFEFSQDYVHRIEIDGFSDFSVKYILQASFAEELCEICLANSAPVHRKQESGIKHITPSHPTSACMPE